MNWDSINCRQCKGHCNAKGYPSVSKGSKYCLQQRGLAPVREKGISLLDKFKNLFNLKGSMRRGGK